MVTDGTVKEQGIPDGITRDDVLQAIKDFDSGVEHPFGPSTYYDLIYDGRRYPPKALLGLAARRLSGRTLTPEEFTGGIESKCFKMLQGLNFTIEPKAGALLPENPAGRVWFEFVNAAEHGGTGWSFPSCLWSPSAAADGKDWYSPMRQIQGGDTVLHALEGRFVGVSDASSGYREVREGPPKAGQWADRPSYYRVDLQNYRPLPTPISVDEFIRQNEVAIRHELGEGNAPKFYPFINYGESLRKAQGIYLAPCTPNLYRLLRQTVLPLTPKGTMITTRPHSADPRVKVWAIALGEGGRIWNECQEAGVAAIGWHYLGDLRQFPNQEAISRAIVAHGDVDTNPINQSLCCWEFAREMQIGDTVVAKIGRRRLLGIGTVTSDYRYDPSRPEFPNLRDVRWVKAKDVDLPQGMRLPTKTLTDVTDFGEFNDFVKDIYAEEVPSETPITTYTLNDALSDIFFPAEVFEKMLTALAIRKNLMLCGPPGVGKTFVARRLAWALLESKDDTRIEMVQFHQSYSYEDFLQGIRPNSEGKFQCRNGIFFEFCNRARLDSSRPYVFIIDEINRGNLSKILGEALSLIEPDKRGSQHAIKLTYAENDERFSVPENVRLLGLMNTADRSLALVDYALRRRFRFINLDPQIGQVAFRRYLVARGAPDTLVDRIVDRISRLNQRIESDHKNLGAGFRIGHSYFCPLDKQVPDAAWYQAVIEEEIAPLIREYWFERHDVAEKWIDELVAP